jgi:acyl-CoA synthetase (AMP-forming)/AMP-acid ligase II
MINNNIFRNKVKEYKGKIFIEHQSSIYKYSFCDILSDKIYNSIGSNNLVLIINNNKPMALLGYYACLLSNNIPMLISNKSSFDIINKIVIDYGIKYIYADNEIIIEHLKSIFCFFDATLYDTQNKKQRINPDIATLIFTSGTTGDSKAVCLTRKNLEFAAQISSEEYNIKDSDKMLALLPINNISGLILSNMHFVSGASILYPENIMLSKEFFDEVDTKNVTNFAGVPYTFEILQKMGFFNKNLEKLRFIIKGGAPNHPKTQKTLIEYAKKFKKNYYNAYGQTETSSMITFYLCESIEKNVNCVGKPYQHIEVLIENDESQLSNRPYELGEICVKGLNVMAKYVNNLSELNDIDLSNTPRMHKTGDVGYFDEDGYLYVTGRIARFAKILGERYNLNHIEMILNQEFYNNIFAVIEYDKKICIYTDSTMQKELIEFLQSKIMIHKNHIRVIYTKDIERLENGKIDYRLLIAKQG